MHSSFRSCDPSVAPVISEAAGSLHCIAYDIDACIGSVALKAVDVPATFVEADAVILASIASVLLRKGSLRLCQLADVAHCGESPITDNSWRSLRSARRIAEMLHRVLPDETPQALAIADAASNYPHLLPAATAAYRYHRHRDSSSQHSPATIELATRLSPFRRYAEEISRAIETLRESGPDHGYIAEQLMIQCDILADGPARVLAELPSFRPI